MAHHRLLSAASHCYKAQHQRDHILIHQKTISSCKFDHIVQQRAISQHFLHRHHNFDTGDNLHFLSFGELDVSSYTSKRLDFNHGIHLAAWRDDHFLHWYCRYLSFQNIYGNQTAPVHDRETNLCQTTRLIYCGTLLTTTATSWRSTGRRRVASIGIAKRVSSYALNNYAKL